MVRSTLDLKGSLGAQDFRQIASFLDHRSTQDCVQFYYKTQKLDEFAAVRRKQQLKKRRLQSDINRSVTYMGIAAPGKGAARISITGKQRFLCPLPRITGQRLQQHQSI